MFPIINLGPAAIQAAGLILLLSLWIGTWLTGKFADKLGTNGEVIENSILIGLIGGILGARIGFMLQNPSVFLDNPLSLLSLTPSMLDVNFGLLVGGLAVFINAQKKHLPLWPTLDTLSPLILLLFAGVHLANYANGDAYGLPTEFPWGVQLWNALRHPVQIYTLILTAGFIIWLMVHTKWLSTTGFMRSGILFNFIMAGVAVITIITRTFVAQKTLLAGMDTVQLLGLIVFSGSLALIYTSLYRTRKHIGVLISLGSNIDPQRHLSDALESIKSAFKLRRASSTYQTENVRESAKTPPFLNQVIEIETTLPYPELVSQLKSIEQNFGRESGNKAVVPLDLDVLTYNSDVFTHQGKYIPNKDMLKYRYIAVPLAELLPGFRHPGNGTSIQTILDNIEDKSLVALSEKVENGITR